VPKSELAIRWLNHQCRRMPTAIETRCAVSLGSVESLDQDQKSEGTCGNSRYRRNVLRKGQAMDRPALTATVSGKPLGDSAAILYSMRERSGDIDLSQNHSARQQRRGPTRYDLDKL
jgi:hypothetical protein